MAIEGKIEAIKSPNSTPDKEIITIPFSTANAVYFPDGTTLLNKYTNGELGSSSGSSSVSYVPNKWHGKNVVCFGDSITAGGYPNVIAKVLGAFVTNKGSSGGTYVRDWNIINDTDLTYANAVTFMTGHNGGAGSMTLETSGLLDVTDASNFESYPNNYYGGLGKLINYVRITYPNIKIYLLGLHYTTRNNTSKDCQRALKEIGDYYAVPFIDVYANCGICKTNLSVYSSDGTHLNSEGNALLGEYIAYQMMYN